MVVTGVVEYDCSIVLRREVSGDLPSLLKAQLVCLKLIGVAESFCPILTRAGPGTSGAGHLGGTLRSL